MLQCFYHIVFSAIFFWADVYKACLCGLAQIPAFMGVTYAAHDVHARRSTYHLFYNVVWSSYSFYILIFYTPPTTINRIFGPHCKTKLRRYGRVRRFDMPPRGAIPWW